MYINKNKISLYWKWSRLARSYVFQWLGPLENNKMATIKSTIGKQNAIGKQKRGLTLEFRIRSVFQPPLYWGITWVPGNWMGCGVICLSGGVLVSRNCPKILPFLINKFEFPCSASPTAKLILTLNPQQTNKILYIFEFGFYLIHSWMDTITPSSCN